MLGQFVNPGKIIYESLLTIDNYIELAGGFGWRAIEGDVRIIRAKTGEWVDADEDVLLQPGDTIWVPADPPGPKFWEVFMDALTVVAQLAAIVAASAGGSMVTGALCSDASGSCALVVEAGGREGPLAARA